MSSRYLAEKAFLKSPTSVHSNADLALTGTTTANTVAASVAVTAPAATFTTGNVTTLVMNGLATVKSYTVATVPAATSHAGAVVYLTDGNAGAACLAVSNGTAWKVVALGATASAT